MKKENKSLIIAALISLIAAFSLSIKAQSTINSYTFTTKFLQSDFQQIYQGARIAAPTMTLPNSLTTYTYSKPFNNSDNQQVYEAIRGIGATVSSLTANYWSINGNSLTAGTEFLGSTNAMPLYIKTNNTTAATIGTNQAVNFVSSVTTPSLYGSTTNSILNIFSNANGGGTVNIGTGTGTLMVNNFTRIKPSLTAWLDFNDNGGAFPAIWANRNNSKTSSNYNIAMDQYDMLLNDSSSIQLRLQNSVAFNVANPRLTGTQSDFSTFQPPSFQKTTLQEYRNLRILAKTQGFAVGGTLALQRSFLHESITYTAASAATITDLYTSFFTKGIAGSGVTITRNWGIGTDGSALITESLVVGQASRTPTATLDVAGTMSISSTATVAGILNTPTVNSTGTNLILNSSSNTNLNVNNVTILNAYSSGIAVTGLISATGNISSSSKTAGIGYAVGSGSTVTQGTSRTTGVTINSITGAITLFSTAGSTTYQSFTVTNSAVTAKDVIIVNQQTGTDLYEIHVTNIAAGSFRITFATTGGTTTETPIFNFAVIKGQTN